MAVPDYQSLMAPVLRSIEDGKTRSAAEIRQAVARELGITANDMHETVKSGQPVFDSRVNWALTYMGQAGLLRRPKRGANEITDRGKAVLHDHPTRIDNRILTSFQEFKDFKSRARGASMSTGAALATAPPSVVSNTATPHETITAAVEENNAAVAADLLVRVREQDPTFLERVVLLVLTAMGYGGAAGSAEQLGRSGDEGLDGIIRQDPLGLDRIYVQAKRYAADRAVGRPDIQGFVGALHGAQADRGVFITTSRFSHDAHDYADKVAARVILIDGVTLADLLVKFNIGAQDYQSYVLKRVDEDFFEDS